MGAKALPSTWKGASNLDRNMIPTMTMLSGSRGWIAERSCLEEAAEGTFSILAWSHVLGAAVLHPIGIPISTSNLQP